MSMEDWTSEFIGWTTRVWRTMNATIVPAVKPVPPLSVSAATR